MKKLIKIDEEKFEKLKNELINEDNSLVVQYNKIQEKTKCKILKELLDNFRKNYRELFKIYKNGKGIIEAKDYLEIGRLYIDTINFELNQLNVQRSIMYAWISIGVGFVSVILAILTLIAPENVTSLFSWKTTIDQPHKIECCNCPKNTNILIEKNDTALLDSFWPKPPFLK